MSVCPPFGSVAVVVRLTVAPAFADWSAIASKEGAFGIFEADAEGKQRSAVADHSVVRGRVEFRRAGIGDSA
jgi:hypothetical protein